MLRRSYAAVPIVLISVAIAYAGWTYGCTSVHNLQLAAFVGAFLSLLWSLVGAGAGVLTGAGRGLEATGEVVGVSRHPNTFHIAALLFAVPPGVIEAIILTMRVVYVAIDLVFGAPAFVVREYGYSADGLWSLITILLSCLIAMFSTRDRRLVTCALWLGVAIVVWYFLLDEVFRKTVMDGWERTGASVWMTAGIGTLLFVVTALTARLDRRRRWRAALTRPETLIDGLPAWPGLRPTVTSFLVLLMVLTSYHILVPVAVWPGGFRAGVLITAIGGVVAASSGFVILARSWSGHLADAALGLMSLSFAGLAVAGVPMHEAGLAEHYPAVFSASIVGLAVACALWTWLSGVWHQQLDAGHAWTTAGHLIPHTKRGAFLAAALALLISGLLAVWPRMRGIPATDDTLIAVATGLWAHLFLLLVLLWAARRHRLASFYVLGMLTVVSTIAFIVMRLLPFSPQFG